MSTNRTAERLSHLRAQLVQVSGRDPLITPSSLQVTLDGDTVLISGMVPHVAAKERVSEIARELAPDLIIDNSCVIDGMAAAPDGELVNRAGDWLRRTFGRDAGTMSVLINHGKAYLRGTWPSITAIRQARMVIGSYAGIHTIDASGVTLRQATQAEAGPVAPLAGDELVNTLQERLAKTGYRLGDWVDARIMHGRLELIGIVDTEAAHRQVLETAARLPGVRRVIDHLVARDSSRASDQAVELRVRRRWAQHHVAAPDLQVFVSGSQAFVRGQVDTPELRARALQILREDPAVRQIVDHIQIVTRRSRPA